MFKNTIAIEVEAMEAITYEDIDDIGANQTNEYIGGWFPFFAELLEESKELNDIIKGMNIDKASKVIATKHPHNFKRGDLVRLYGRDKYKIDAVKITIDPNYTNTVRMFPLAKDQYTWKVLILG